VHRWLQRGQPPGGPHTGPNPTDRGQLGSKRHVLTDANGTPVMFCVTGANRHDSVVFEEMIDALPAIKGKPGRPRRWPDKLHADKAYDCRRCRQHLRRLGIRVRFERSTSTHVALLSLACSIICLRTLRRVSDQPSPLE
jgi:IS5 family transposase